MEGRPRYMSIMYGRITDKDKDESCFDNSSVDNHRQAHHQMLAHHQWLSYCPEEALFFQNFEVSKPVCTAYINEKWHLIETS
jgi:hypothetical protein